MQAKTQGKYMVAVGCVILPARRTIREMIVLPSHVTNPAGPAGLFRQQDSIASSLMLARLTKGAAIHWQSSNPSSRASSHYRRSSRVFASNPPQNQLLSMASSLTDPCTGLTEPGYTQAHHVMRGALGHEAPPLRTPLSSV